MRQLKRKPDGYAQGKPQSGPERVSISVGSVCSSSELPGHFSRSVIYSGKVAGLMPGRTVKVKR